MKGKTIGYFKNVQNIPYCKAAVDLKVGMGVILDRESGLAKLPKDVAEAKTVVYVVSNINDKPELHLSSLTADVNKGEFVRVDDMHTVNRLEVEISYREINGGTNGLAKNDMLVYGTDGLLVKTADASGYALAFRVMEKTTYKGDGVLAEVVCA